MRKLSVVAVVLFTCVFVSCQNDEPAPNGDINVTNTNVNNNIIGGPTTPSGGSQAQCVAVGSVRIVAIPGSLDVGESGRIDATPRDVNGQSRSDECNELSGANWTVEDPDVCTVQDPAQFTTNVEGKGAGTCRITVDVDGYRDTATFPVS